MRYAISSLTDYKVIDGVERAEFGHCWLEFYNKDGIVFYAIPTDTVCFVSKVEEE